MNEAEAERFNIVVQKILSVSRDELKHRQEKWKKGKRKLKASASGRASHAKG